MSRRISRIVSTTSPLHVYGIFSWCMISVGNDNLSWKSCQLSSFAEPYCSTSKYCVEYFQHLAIPALNGPRFSAFEKSHVKDRMAPVLVHILTCCDCFQSVQSAHDDFDASAALLCHDRQAACGSTRARSPTPKYDPAPFAQSVAVACLSCWKLDRRVAISRGPRERRVP